MSWLTALSPVSMRPRSMSFVMEVTGTLRMHVKVTASVAVRER